MKPKIEMTSIERYEANMSIRFIYSQDELIRNLILNQELCPSLQYGELLYTRTKTIQKKYDLVGNKIYEVDFSFLNIKKWEYEYHADGKTVKKCIEKTNHGIEEIDYDEDGQEIRCNIYLHDGDGNFELVRATETKVIKRDKMGHPTTLHVFVTMSTPDTKHAPSLDRVIRRKYNKVGELNKEVVFVPALDYWGENLHTVEMTLWNYDTKGRLIEYAHREENTEPDLVKYRDIRYNEDGTIRLIKREKDDYLNDNRKEEVTFEYDQYGNWIKKYITEDEHVIQIEIRTIKYYDK